jgi:hypothetical protein
MCMRVSVCVRCSTSGRKKLFLLRDSIIVDTDALLRVFRKSRPFFFLQLTCA